METRCLDNSGNGVFHNLGSAKLERINPTLAPPFGPANVGHQAKGVAPLHNRLQPEAGFPSLHHEERRTPRADGRITRNQAVM